MEGSTAIALEIGHAETVGAAGVGCRITCVDLSIKRHLMNVEVAIVAPTVVSIVNELDGDVMSTGAEVARQGDVLGLSSGV